MASKLRVDQLEDLAGTKTVNTSDIIDDLNTAQVTTATGTQTVVEALDHRGVVFDSVSDMQNAAYIYIGAKVLTLGYYTPGDGGGNFFEIVAAGTGADDGGSYIDLIGSGFQAKGLFVGGSVNVRQFGAVGDGVADDTSAFVGALSKVTPAYRGGDVLVPTGDYRLTSTVQLHTWHNLIGEGKWNSRILIDHDGAGIEYLYGDNFTVSGINQYQGGNNKISGLFFGRTSLPSARIPGNHAIKMPATFGSTVLEDLQFENMGDSNIYYEDIAPTHVGSGPIHFSRIDSVGAWGYLLEMHNLFAQVFIENYSSVRNGGGFYLDASNSNAGFRAANVAIRDCIVETAGLGPGGVTNSSAGSCLEVINCNGVDIENNYFSCYDGVNTSPTVRLQDNRAVEMSGGNFLVAHTGGTLVTLSSGNDAVHIGSSNLFEGVDRGSIGIYSSGTTDLIIDNPRFSGWGAGDEISIISTGFYPSRISTPLGLVFRASGYTGTLRGLEESQTPYDSSVVPYGLQAKGFATFYISGGANIIEKRGRIDTVTRTGVGVYTVGLSGETRSAYPVNMTVNFAGKPAPVIVHYLSQSSSGFTIEAYDTTTGNPADINSMTVTIL